MAVTIHELHAHPTLSTLPSQPCVRPYGMFASPSHARPLALPSPPPTFTAAHLHRTPAASIPAASLLAQQLVPCAPVLDEMSREPLPPSLRVTTSRTCCARPMPPPSPRRTMVLDIGPYHPVLDHGSRRGAKGNFEFRWEERREEITPAPR